MKKRKARMSPFAGIIQIKFNRMISEQQTGVITVSGEFKHLST